MEGREAMSLRDDLKRDEELRLVVYDDKTGLPLKPGMKLRGYPTIGYGRNLTSRGISPDEADAFLDSDISATMGELDARLPWFRALSGPRREALCNMAFNLGVAGLTKFEHMLRALQLGDFETAAAECLASKWAEEVGDRAIRIAKVIRG
jgi:lysozyme